MRTLENILLRLLTAFGRKSFYCDSHPTLCVACHRVRNLLTSHRKDNIMLIKTKKGVYIWNNTGIPIKVTIDG